MLRLAFALSALLLLTACDSSECGDCMTTGGVGTKIEGSGVMKTEVRPVEPFTSIVVTDVESSLLIIEQTGEESLTVTAEENLLAMFTSEVKHGVLYLTFKKGNSFHGKRPTYKVTVKDLRHIHVQGGVEIEATKLASEKLSILVEGAAAGKLSGRSDDLTIDIKGAGLLSAGDLKAKRAKVSVQGAGQVTVNASDELDAEMSGAGIIWYIGDPKLKSNVNGLGLIKRKPFSS
jgi:Putative auto-transporter adhesin, head GIN domain